MSTGKTIARIDTEPIDADYGGIDHGTVLIYFTDGTALRIEGHSYESVDLELTDLTSDDLATRVAKVEQRLAEESERQHKREEWMALSCDERAARRVNEQAEVRGLRPIMNDAYEGVLTDMMVSMARQLHGAPSSTVRLPCANCGERRCENAPTKPVFTG